MQNVYPRVWLKNVDKEKKFAHATTFLTYHVGSLWFGLGALKNTLTATVQYTVCTFHFDTKAFEFAFEFTFSFASQQSL